MSKEFYTDKNGKDITHGSLVKVFHFTGKRRKKHYMYKIIVKVGKWWRGVHIEDVIKERPLPTENSLQGSYSLPFTKVDGKHEQLPIQLKHFEVLVDGDFIFNNTKWWAIQGVIITRQKPKISSKQKA